MWEAALRAGDRDMFAASAAARLGARLTHVHPAGASAVAGYQAARRRGRGHDAAFAAARLILRRGERPNVVDGEVVDRSRSRSAPGRGPPATAADGADPPVQPGATRRGTASHTRSPPPATTATSPPTDPTSASDHSTQQHTRGEPMVDQPTDSASTGTAVDGAAVDVMAILAAQQDQIDDLAGAVEALSRTVEQLLVAVRER